MTLNRQRLLRYAEYAAVSASVAGAIAAVATRQLVYGVAPLSVAAALNLVNRRQWEQQIEQRLAQTTTQIGQRFDDLAQQNRQLEQRLQALPEVTVENYAQISDLQALREEGSRLFQQLSDDLQVLRQNLARQERGIGRSELDSITADFRQLQLSLAALESLNFDERLHGLEQQAAGEPTGVEDAIAPLRTDLNQLRNDLQQLREEVTRLRILLREAPSTAPLPPTYEVGTDVPEEAIPAPEFQWQPPQLPSNQDFDLELNLGIDFGTGFTKVCFRSLDNNYSEIVTFNDDDSEVQLEQALLSSKIAILEDGTLMTGLTAAEWASMSQPVQKTIEFIKMRLAHLDLPEDGDWRLERISELDDPTTVENLCAYYLSHVIIRAQNWIRYYRADLFKNQRPRWSVSIGVPIEYDKPPIKDRFKQVLDLAWLMAYSPSINQELTINSLNHLSSYLRLWKSENLNNELDCFTTPEVSAALWSFLDTRRAQEEFYTFFDFGDGTLDGTAFRFRRENDGELKLDVYKSKVCPLGITAFSQQAAFDLQTSPGTIREALHQWHQGVDTDLQNSMQNCETRHKVQQLIATVIVNGNRGLQEARGPLVAQDEIGNKLRIYVGGGGGYNPFIHETIYNTHDRFGHDNAGIPPYSIEKLPVPPDLEMNGIDPTEFHRFAVAYGLCIPDWERADLIPPEHVSVNTRNTSLGTNQVASYEDTHDMM